MPTEAVQAVQAVQEAPAVEPKPKDWVPKRYIPPSATILKSQALELLSRMVEEFWGTNQIEDGPYKALTDLHDILVGLSDRGWDNRRASHSWLKDLYKTYLPEGLSPNCSEPPIEFLKTQQDQDDLEMGPGDYPSLLDDCGLQEDEYHGNSRDDT